jgi:hypothetical protein
MKSLLKQSGGDKPFITNKNINLFTDPEMEKHLNPIYGLFMCESGFLVNNFCLFKKFGKEYPELNTTLEKIFPPTDILDSGLSVTLTKIFTDNSHLRIINNEIQPYRKIIEEIELIDICRYIAIKFVNKNEDLFAKINKSGNIFFKKHDDVFDKADKEKLLSWIRKFTKYDSFFENNILLFHILLFYIWWKADSDEGIITYYRGIDDVFSIVNYVL